MQAAKQIVLPYEPQYVGHREAEARHQQTREWLRQRERDVDGKSPSIVPKDAPEDDRA